MKSTPDDNIYTTPNGMKVRIVPSKQRPIDPKDPQWLQEIKTRPIFTVARVSDGRLLYGYKMEDLIRKIK